MIHVIIIIKNYRQDEQRRKTGFVREKPKIELGAVLDTTCRKCGGSGILFYLRILPLYGNVMWLGKYWIGFCYCPIRFYVSDWTETKPISTFLM